MGAASPICNHPKAYRPFRGRVSAGRTERFAPQCRSLKLLEQLIRSLKSTMGKIPTSRRRTALVALGGHRSAGVSAPGEVWLVGAGPGDPELLTLKALKALQRADVVVHDGLVSEAILDLAPSGARRLSVAKRKSRHSYAQDAINRLLVAFAREGLTTVR